MVEEKPPFFPPDTDDPRGRHPPDDYPVQGSLCFTEGTESVVTTLTKKQDKELNPEKYALILSVYFEITNESNAACFLFMLLDYLQLVDPTAHILPHGDMPVETPAYASTDQIPSDASLSSFTHAYLSGLRVIGKTMMGKFWIKCQKKLPEFKANPVFLGWLKGKNTSKRVTLDAMNMNGTERFPVGFFVNAVTENRLLENFNYQIANLLEAHTHEETPEFQCDVNTMYSANEATRVYRMMTNSRASIKTLQDQTLALVGKPSTNLTFIPYSVWAGLDDGKKTAYRRMQHQFAENVCAIRLSGLRDTSLEIYESLPSKSGRSSDKKKSIMSWITSAKASDTTNMFFKSSVCPNGNVELWLYKSHQREAREWEKVALAAIATLSRIDIGDERERAEEMFNDPERVWRQMEASNPATSLPNQRSAFVDFQPPNAQTASGTAGTASTRSKPKGHPKREKMVLHFDMELVKQYQEKAKMAPSQQAAAAILSNTKTATTSKRGKEKAKVAAPKSSGPVQGKSINPHAAAEVAAKSAALKALKIGQAAIAKYPPTAIEQVTHAGKFYTVKDQFGNIFPVVYVSNVAQPLNEVNLLSSRRETENQNDDFSIVSTPAKSQWRGDSTYSEAVAAQPPTPSQVETPIISNTRGTPPNFSRHLAGTNLLTSLEVAARQPAVPRWRTSSRNESTIDVNQSPASIV